DDQRRDDERLPAGCAVGRVVGRPVIVRILPRPNSIGEERHRVVLAFAGPLTERLLFDQSRGLYVIWRHVPLAGRAPCALDDGEKPGWGRADAENDRT